ncbi:hypothetical protein HYFRA_00003180 [Hymenoscyphus fraxineus]|uniref:Uncharacterized protein n=1 Tax=Hymenoscyphus fraxineus TaxID=746836 RepID=A0A9N9KRV5_9HELO|nr:hypothetical protein HYFRA_00003180 [Hymenoscyphus fraxineus]
MSGHSKKLTTKEFTKSAGQVLRDLRDLQKTGHTLPDIIYNYRMEDGRVVRKRYREGSQSGSDREDSEDESKLHASKAKAKADQNTAAAAKMAPDAGVKVWRRTSKRYQPETPRSEMQTDTMHGRELHDMTGVGVVGEQSEGVVGSSVTRKPVGSAKARQERSEN